MLIALHFWPLKSVTRSKSVARWAIGLAVVGIVVLVCTGLMARSRTGRERAVRAVGRAIDEGRLAEAGDELAVLLQRRPNDAEVHFLKARLALAKGDLKEVTEALNAAKSRGLPPARLERFDAIVKASLGNFAEAEPVLARLFLEADGPDPEVDEALARCYLQTYQLHKAGTVLERWMRDAPRDGRPYLWQTEIDNRIAIDSFSPHEEHYRAALERDPNLDKARLGLADLLRRAQRGEESAREYDRYLARNPNDVTALVGAARNAGNRGDEPAQVRYLERALAIAPDNSEALKERAAIEQHHGDYRAALERFDRALKVNPFDEELLYKRSFALDRLGRRAEANADRKRLNKLKEEQAEVLKTRDALLHNPNDIRLRLDVARWMFDHGREDEALRWTKHVLELDPKYAPANALLADYYQRKGDVGLANFYRLQVPSEGQTP
jgi:tetratricopeptide (TPR) repeat protein